jgi:hypothetical protein
LKSKLFIYQIVTANFDETRAESPLPDIKENFRDHEARKDITECEEEYLLPVETLGGWHNKAAEQLRKLARAQARSSGRD